MPTDETPSAHESNALRHPHPPERLAAPQRPAGAGEEDALSALCQALANADSTVRQAAVDALGQRDDPRMAVPLLQRLGDPDPGVRESLAAALGRMGRAVEGDLILALGSDDPNVSAGARRLLHAMGESPLADAIGQALAGNTAPLATVDAPRALPILMRLLEHPEQIVRQKAVTALAALGPFAADSLWPLLAHPLQQTRLSAAEALGRTRNAVVVQQLRVLLTTSDEGSRLLPAVGLGFAGDSRGLTVLTSALARTEPELLACVYAALACLGAEAAERLAGIVCRRPGQMRAQAMRALGGLPGHAIGAALVHLMLSGEGEVRSFASRLLRECGETAVRSLVERLAGCDRRARVQGIHLLVGLGEPAQELLFEMIRSNRRAERALASEALGRIGFPAGSGRLQGLLAAGYAEAAIGLGHLRDARSLAPLIRVLEEDDALARAGAAGALGAPGAAAAPALGALRASSRRPRFPRLHDVGPAYQDAVERIESALRQAPAELEAATDPEGRGTELEWASSPTGRGTELEAAGPL